MVNKLAFRHKKVHTQFSNCVRMRKKNKVNGPTQVGLRVSYRVQAIMGFQYQALTRLIYQSFENRLDLEIRALSDRKILTCYVNQFMRNRVTDLNVNE